MSEPKNIYVHSRGNDLRNDGSVNAPLHSIAEAIYRVGRGYYDVISGVAIYVPPGSYNVD